MKQIKQFFVLVFCTTILLSCNSDIQKGKFTLTGELKNVPDQKIYLEELYFSQKDPAVLDTAEIKNVLVAMNVYFQTDSGCFDGPFETE